MSYEEYQNLHVHIEQGVSFVTIDHPPMNLMNREMVRQLSRFLDEVEQDHAVRVIVFESALPGFFLGNFDLQGLQTPPPVGPKAGTLTPFHLLTERYRTSPKVTIACIDGRTSGGGWEFTLALDMRFAARKGALFLQQDVLGGFIPGGGATQRLPRLLGRARALEVMLSAQEVDAELAERYGWINRSFPDAELGPFVKQLAFRIASLPSYTLHMLKQAVDDGLPSFYDGLREEAYLCEQSRSYPESVERVAQIVARGAKPEQEA
jgi:enoyl-CoA hydratase/carnithine racemase